MPAGTNRQATPELVGDFSWNKEKKTAELKLTQVIAPTPGQATKRSHHIPVEIGLLDANGKDMPLTLDKQGPVADGTIHVTRKEQTFRFTDVETKPVLSLLRGFSAPVNLELEQSDSELEFLMAHDSDPFNRCQAAQTFAARNMLEMVDAIGKGKRAGRGTQFIKALATAITDETLEPAYRALLLALPSEGDIARQIGTNVDPDAIHKARNQLRRNIGRVLKDDLAKLYRKHKISDSYSPDAASVGQRALRNSALALLAADSNEETLARVVRHFKFATNMTDQTAALGILSHTEGLNATKPLQVSTVAGRTTTSSSTAGSRSRRHPPAQRRWSGSKNSRVTICSP